ncbi:hypothetical protein TanjilG_19436 [Lupinus angustifolius]|uniref:BHLH domain-containing protein n=1 Tax=Lupinus angustifolius TaxID=3871 RepID=A0A4P1R4K2_LUPAN|nr:PREDICTED: transcription factor PAR1-like [Lupinus angustifolius]OIW01510.1 hypothetical protein TanjilG_19436 [Lupinus angustifolius]
MGVSSHPLLVSPSLKNIPKATEENKSSSYEWNKVLVTQDTKQKGTKKSVKGRKQGKILRKKRTLLVEGSRRQAKEIQRRVRTLKRLIPNNQYMGLDGLYRETFDYILSLQIKVKAMQLMVQTLTG